jgi:hypothetical protein
MSLTPNAVCVNPLQTIYAPSLLSGTVTFTGAASTFTISTNTQGMLSTSVVVGSYEHPGGGGAGQFVTILQPGTNQFQLGLGQNSANGEQFNWIAIR